MGLSSLLRSNETEVLYIEVDGLDVSFNASAATAALNTSMSADSSWAETNSQTLVATEVDAGALDPLALILDEEMPSVAWNLLLMSVILLLSVLLVGKSLGGWYFLAINFVVFTALCKMFRSHHEYSRNLLPVCID
eukprot:SAG31_NODE_1468_length_8223_cov_37.850320_3_plen_136_part_00